MSINNTEIRLLLNLWDFGEGQGVVNKGKLLVRIQVRMGMRDRLAGSIKA